MCQYRANKNPCLGYWMVLSLTPHVPLTTQTGGRKVPLSSFSQPVEGCWKWQSNIFRIHWLVVKWSGCEAGWTIIRLLPKPQMSESRSSTICAAVEQSDHHCGDDLVKRLDKFRMNNFFLPVSLIENNIFHFHDTFYLSSFMDLIRS